MNQGIELIIDLPEDTKLNDKQKVQVGCVRSGITYIDKKSIKEFLKTLKYPLYMLDFETVSAAIPLFDKSRPFQQIPFQLSLHIINKEGEKAEHIEFLADSPEDPRKSIMETLRKIDSKGTVLAYNMSFEKNVIEDLLEQFPKEKWLQTIIDRLNDLLIPFRNFWYHSPLQHGSCSIKNVLPALTKKDYSDLEINKGDVAAREFMAMTYKGEPMDKEAVREALLEYCKQDTQAMIDVLNVLEKVII